MRPYQSVLLYCEPSALRDILMLSASENSIASATPVALPPVLTTVPSASMLKNKASLYGSDIVDLQSGQVLNRENIEPSREVPPNINPDKHGQSILESDFALNFIQRRLNPLRALQIINACSPTVSMSEMCMSLECTLSEVVYHYIILLQHQSIVT